METQQDWWQTLMRIKGQLTKYSHGYFSRIHIIKIQYTCALQFLSNSFNIYVQKGRHLMLIKIIHEYKKNNNKGISTCLPFFVGDSKCSWLFYFRAVIKFLRKFSRHFTFWVLYNFVGETDYPPMLSGITKFLHSR